MIQLLIILGYIVLGLVCIGYVLYHGTTAVSTDSAALTDSAEPNDALYANVWWFSLPW
jgi:hypothetical protein